MPRDALVSKSLKFTLIGPHMFTKSLIDKLYGRLKDVALAITEVLAEQVRHPGAPVVQLDEANLPGNSEE